MPYLQGQFPTFTGTVIPDENMSDATFGSSNPGHTLGAQVLLRLNAQPTIIKPWTINAWAIHGHGVISAASGVTIGGQLGKVYAALVIGSFSPTFGTSTPFSTPPEQALPNLVKLWDGQTDTPFPVTTGGTSPLDAYFSSSQQLPQPQEMGASDQIGIGVWLTPSVLKDQRQAIIIAGLGYSVTYQ